MCRANQAASWAERTANDNRHGYSQAVRWGPSYDCSSFVISAFEAAGVPVKAAGATSTGDMKAAFLRSGFADVSAQVNMKTGAGAVRGDVFLNENGRGVPGSTGHTVVYLGGGKVANCRSSEGTSDTADNSGNEIRIQSFWPYPWDCCLRLSDVSNLDTQTDSVIVSNLDTQTGLAADGVFGPDAWLELAKRMPTVKYGDDNWAVAALQAGLNYLGADLDVDRKLGRLTHAEIIKFQK